MFDEIQFVHWVNPSNTGDTASCPLNYVDVECCATRIPVQEPDRVNPALPLILGGGGIANKTPLFADVVAPKVIWGAGGNAARVKDKDILPNDYACWDLVGIRDWDRGYPWVPCVSCLHPAFDNNVPIQHEYVVYEGNRLPFTNYPTKRCTTGASMEEILTHLSSGETIITSSYHGWYWGTLLNRRVIVIPNQNASKFYHFYWKTPLARCDNWRDSLHKTTSHPNALSHARAVNIAYLDRVFNLLKVAYQLKG